MLEETGAEFLLLPGAGGAASVRRTSSVGAAAGDRGAGGAAADALRTLPEPAGHRARAGAVPARRA